MKLHVLIVEDDYDLAASIMEYLTRSDIVCEHAADGQLGLELATTQQYDVLLFDVMMPRIDGLTLCEMLRDKGFDTPIMMITACDTLDDKVAGFAVGTDDYIIKPFAMKELLCRIQALSKRRSSQARVFAVEDLVINIAEHSVTRGGKAIQLTPTEWELAVELARQSPLSVPKQQLLQAVWGEDFPETNALKVHMHSLRKKVDKGFDVPLIQTISRYGFAMRKADGKIS